MFKKKFMEIGRDPEGFAVVNRGAFLGLPEGLLEAEDVLRDLWDIGCKFGSEGQNGVRFKAEPLVLELYDFQRIRNSGELGLTVGKAGVMTGAVAAVRIQIFKLRNGIRVIWDKEIGVPEVRRIIREIDAYALSQGAIKDGVRLMDNGLVALKSVVQVFQEKDTFILAMPDDLDIVLSKFDHPETLTVLDVGMIFKVICLSSDRKEVQKKVEEKLRQIEEEFNITPKKTSDLSANEKEKWSKPFSS